MPRRYEWYPAAAEASSSALMAGQRPLVLARYVAVELIETTQVIARSVTSVIEISGSNPCASSTPH